MMTTKAWCREAAGVVSRDGEGVQMDTGLKKLVCSRHVASFVPESMIREAQIFPLECSSRLFNFTVAAPLSYEWLDTLEFILDRQIRRIARYLRTR
jgi:hypothetical protein